MLATGTVLQERYRIIRQLGHGGMGAVYEAQDKVFETTVALKEILIDLTRTSTPKQQELLKHAFEREAKILAKVKHEVFPHVRDYFAQVDRQYLVMELVDGEDLAELLKKRQNPFLLKDVLGWVYQLLDALDYLHTLKPPVIHRDIKPQNLKLTNRGKIKLLDFGIAKGTDAQGNTTITNQTFVAATLHYSPLEQILRVLDPTFREVITQRYDEKSEEVLSQNADARSDIYSLGATFYHLLTGTLPMDALKRSLELWAGKSDPLPKLRELNPQIPESISNIFHKAIEVERENRFNTALEMQWAFHEAIENERRRDEESRQAVWLAQQERLEKERQFIEEERRRIEAERQYHLKQIEEGKSQSELDKQLLLEAEKQKQIAELRALEAEKRLLALEKEKRSVLETPKEMAERESEETAKTEPYFAAFPVTEAFIMPPGKSEETSFLTQTAVEPKSKEAIAKPLEDSVISESLFEFENSVEPDETGEINDLRAIKSINENDSGIFVFTEFKGNSNWLLPLAALILVILGGGVLGMWLWQNNSEAVEVNKTVSENSNAAPPPEQPIGPITTTETLIETSNKTLYEVNGAKNSSIVLTPKSSAETKKRVESSAPSAQSREPLSNPAVRKTPPPVQKKTPAKPSNPDCIFTDDCK
ncbi:MAG TPA: protein kinase [Pyrinomonadaceae bacterium]|nr:protein kinase [Pyrinomonadaceae bacterium]